MACVQLLKWAGLQGRYAPYGVMVTSLLGVAIWAWDQGGFVRGMAFSYLSGWISIALTAAGVKVVKSPADIGKAIKEVL